MKLTTSIVFIKLVSKISVRERVIIRE